MQEIFIGLVALIVAAMIIYAACNSEPFDDWDDYGW